MIIPYFFMDEITIKKSFQITKLDEIVYNSPYVASSLQWL